MSASIEVEMCEFNASIQVTELLMKTLENASRKFACQCIRESAGRHGFDAEEEIRLLGLENLTLIRKPMTKKSVSEPKKKDKKPKEPKKSVFPIPFVPELCDLTCCNGLAYNRGLFTQCSKKRVDGASYCNICLEQATKNASGEPDCGTLDTRLATGLYEFKDPNGRNPISYLKLLDKLKITQDTAIEEAGKLSIEIPKEHFETIEKTNKSKGRPKKMEAIEADNVTDLFAKLSTEGDDEVMDDDSEEQLVKHSKKSKLTDEEKEAKKIALQEERDLKKAEREAKIAAEKAEKEAKIAAEKAEKEAKIAAEKAERDAKKEATRKAEAEAKKAEREAKLATEKAEKEATRKAEADAKKASKLATDKMIERDTKKAAEKAETEEKKETQTPPKTTPASDTPQAKVSVTRIQISGKAYLKSSTNILYDPETKEEVGLWDPATKTIKDLPDEDDDEVEEDEYDDEE